MSDTDRTNILIVDDLPEKLLVYQSILEGLGHHLIAVRSGAEALKQVLRHDFAVILLDVQMPIMDGFETAALIRQRKKSAHTPIIFITAFADEMHVAQGYALGAVDFIPSPVVPEILRSKVQVFADLFRMTQLVKRQAAERLALAEEKAKRAAAEEINQRLGFLARAGSVLGQSLDQEETARDLARLPVPFLADVGAVVLADRPRAFVARHGPDGEVTLEEADGPEGLPPELAGLVSRVLATEGREATPPLPGCQALVRPLRARGRTLAALALSAAPSGRKFGPAELSMVETLISRGAVALDNARLCQDLQEADRRKDQFLAMLAHELRNPLGPINNAVQVLKLIGAREPNQAKARDMIARQVAHMARLVDDLLDATRLARGKILLRRERCDLARIVRQTAEDYRSVFEASGLRLTVDVPAGPLWLFGDPTRLAQMVGNLLHNAHKFTNPDGEVAVRVTTAADAGSAQVSVRDTGIGIEASVLPHVFDVFSQADHSLDRSRGGLGLGLALVKGLAELHSGEVKAISAGPGQGAEFLLRLPLDRLPEPAPVAPAEEPKGSRSRVLVIEDNPDSAESTRLLLELSGHEVQTAFTGPAGLDAARQFRPQIILCDIGLPGGMNGYDVVRAVRQDPQLAPTYVVALTGYGRDEDQRQAHSAGFDLHLTKPVDFDNLRRVLAGRPARG